MVKLSALVCVQDQDARLSECLRRLWFCDEVVVVADGCGSGVVEVARRHGASVVEGAFPLESQRKPAGVAACRGDWILEVEPDERVDSALAWEIRATLKMGVAGDHLEIPLHAYVGERRLVGGWTEPLGASRAVRLFRPGAKRWAARRRDPGLGLGRSAGSLRGALRRETGDLGGLISAFERSTRQVAGDLAEAGRPGSVPGALVRGLGAALRSYVACGGWREGGLGLLLAALAGLHPLVARLRALEAGEVRPEPASAAPRRRDAAAAAMVRLGVG